MRSKKILLIFGTRPEAIKMAPVFHLLNSDDDFEVEVCVTAQHREMLDQVLKIFKISPKWDLNLMKPNQDIVSLTSKIFSNLNKVLDQYNPDIVLIHGDTITTFAAASVCFLKNIKIGHVEAGLRTGDIYAPFPEEFNRRVASIVSKWHFTPTVTSKNNLVKEGVPKNSIFITGNTVIDSLKMTLDSLRNDNQKQQEINDALDAEINFNWRFEKFILVTGHRRENFGQGFRNICSAILELSLLYRDINFVYPAHFNPNVLDPVKSILGNSPNIHIIKPLEYESFVCLLDASYLVLTDSGGIQEEAPSLGKPVVVMRDLTERPEGLESGTVLLAGKDKNKIVKTISKLISDKSLYNKMSLAHNPYGDGKASDNIVKILKNVINDD